MIKLNIQLVSRCYTLFSLLRKYIFNCLIITTNKYCSGGRAALKTSTFRYKKRKRLVEKPEKLHSINLFSSILIFGLKVLNGASEQKQIFSRIKDFPIVLTFQRTQKKNMEL